MVGESVGHPRSLRALRCAALLLAILLAFGCTGQDSSPPPLTAEVPLHLEDHLDAATIVGSDVPADIPEPVEWRFDEPQPGWKPAIPRSAGSRAADVSRIDDALRMRLQEIEFRSVGIWRAPDAIYVDLPDWTREDWAYVEVMARASPGVERLGIAFNLPAGRLKDLATSWGIPDTFFFPGEYVDVFNDGSVQTYRMRADWSWRSAYWDGSWRQLGVAAQARPGRLDKPAYVDFLSVSVIPKEADYLAEPLGVRTEVRDQAYRRTLYTHAPARIEYSVTLPPGARLDFGLGVLRNDVPVSFRVIVRPSGGDARVLFEESYADKQHWAQRNVDLAHLAGETVTLSLENDSERVGSVALWSAPTLSGAGANGKPNVIFYVIDGGAASQMSVYGYNRRTTPNLDRLADQGAVFENAYSNSSFTRPSTASFMSSLQHSVFGGLRNNRNPIPAEVMTMAERMHRAGYQTSVFTSNPNAGTMSNLDRGVDVLRETGVGDGRYAESSKHLHDEFWSWRASYPGKPYWVHFQTTDVHEYDDAAGVPPFAGLFANAEQRSVYDDWYSRLSEAGGTDPYSTAFEATGISRTSFFGTQRDLYDEAMASQDHQIGRLVERLQATGEWANTLLVIAADHSFLAAGDDDFAIGILDPLPPRVQARWPGGAMFRPSVSRIPLIFVWPGHIAPGRRFHDPVSMIDVLPTVLDLAGLPMPEVMQGQSLAPLLLGSKSWKPRPVVLDEFRADPETGELRGVIEVVDGQWGASLEINPDPDVPPEERRAAPLLLFDLWNDPYCLNSLHEERLDLVEKYTEFLEAQFAAHQALAQQFTPGAEVALTPEQLRTLRALGYIQ